MSDTRAAHPTTLRHYLAARHAQSALASADSSGNPLGDDALASAPQAAPDTAVKPTRAQLATLTFGYLIALPIILILIGLAISRRRRRR